jgi:hypothetical protein
VEATEGCWRLCQQDADADLILQSSKTGCQQ